MRLPFDINEMRKVPINPQMERDGKGWSFSYVYYLRNLKDIYLLLYKNEDVTSMSQLLAICKSNNVQTESGKEWNGRYLLEFVNALKNFELIDHDNKTIKGKLFESEINAPLTQKDKDVFINIYASYFRFQEFHNLFGIFSDVSHSMIVYAYMEDCRFYNRFVCTEKDTLFYIDNNHQEMMRFWDVYTKWGTTLQVLNKCSLSALDIVSDNDELKNAYLYSLAVQIPESFSILDYINEESTSKYIYIPELERDLIYKFKFSIESIKNRLIEETNKRSSEYRLQRTSEIFVDNTTKPLLPYTENVYMSHIIKM